MYKYFCYIIFIAHERRLQVQIFKNKVRKGHNEMQRTLVIAEAGVNHNGSVELAHRLIDVAKDAGADVVKFQTWITELVLRNDAPLAEYQKKTNAETMFDLIKGLELSWQDFAELKTHCDEIGIEFLSSRDVVS